VKLNPQEKGTLADWLWLAAENAPDLSPAQAEKLQARAEQALVDASKRFSLLRAESGERRAGPGSPTPATARAGAGLASAWAARVSALRSL